MVRWEPGARDRLRAAALQLFADRGFEQTTASDIAESVGLTERTFFRHFADKREVLFDGQDLFQELFVTGVASATGGASAVDLVADALQTASAFFPDDRRAYSRLRQTIIVENPGLQERELLKMARLSEGIAVALRERGIPEPQATLAAESGVTVFGVAFRQWIAADERRSLAEIERDILGELRTLTAPAR
ncbi:MAG TPA: TetR family transcriptional regulator [Lacisediminihabitans sp.]|uniref:TetR family transcriptional regulator n=1 Tax=Lacisediminihabitans sp. TaxID=2787631 RepID=UPI002EDB363E